MAASDASAPSAVPRITLPARLTAHTTAGPWRAAMALLRDHPRQRVVVDASALEFADEAGLALLYALRHAPREAGAEPDIAGLAAPIASLLDRFSPRSGITEARPPRLGRVTRIGRATAGAARTLTISIAFVGRCTASLARGLRAPASLRWSEVLAVATQAGANAVPIVCLIGFLMGVIIAFQSAQVAEQFGATIFVVNGVGVAMLRELGPLMTAVVFAGRSGAAFAAQLGTQKVNEEINAITTFGLDPVDFLVRPRLVAAALVVPLLVVLADLIGIVGGAIVMLGFDLSFVQFYHQLLGAVDAGDFIVGLVKAIVFGLTITAIACEQGLATGAGAAAVGVSTTRAVVLGIVWIVVIDGVFAVMLSRWGL